MGFVGIARDEETHQPMPYMESLPESLAGPPGVRARPDARHRRLDGAHDRAARRARRRATSPPSARWPRRRASRGCADSGLPVRLVTGQRRRAAQRLGLHRPRPRRRGRPPVRRGLGGTLPDASPRAPRARRPAAVVARPGRQGRRAGAARPSRARSPTAPATRARCRGRGADAFARRPAARRPQRREAVPRPRSAPPRPTAAAPQNISANKCGSASAASR